MFFGVFVKLKKKLKYKPKTNFLSLHAYFCFEK